jgi:hypothetical protein
MYLFFSVLCIILGAIFLSFLLAFWKTLKMDFWHISSLTIFVIFQMIVFFQKTHLRLFEWKTSSKCFLWNHMNGTLHIELKWDNELICNIWLSISSNLVIVWMVFEIYLHFAIYRYDYNFFTNILFNHLISISKWDFFFTILLFGFWTTLFQVLFAKKCFNFSLVEAQIHAISKSSICDNNFWPL